MSKDADIPHSGMGRHTPHSGMVASSFPLTSYSSTPALRKYCVFLNKVTILSLSSISMSLGREHLAVCRNRLRQKDKKDWTLDDELFFLGEEDYQEVLKAAEKTGSSAKSQGFFSDACKSPMKALLLFYLNSGCGRFDEWKSHSKKYEGAPVDVPKLMAELEKEKLTDEELSQKFHDFSRLHPGMPDKLLGCTTCGMRKFEEKMEIKDIEDPLVQRFKYTDEDETIFKNKLKVFDDNPMTIFTGPELSDTALINPWHVKSFWVGEDGRFWHFHPELVITDGGRKKVALCEDCAKTSKKKKDKSLEAEQLPERCIASGIDFGLLRRIKLPEPNFHEMCIVSKIRLYTSVVKASSNQVGRVNWGRNKWKYHNIMFAHDAPEVASDYLTDKNHLFGDGRLKELMKIFLLDPKGNLDRMSRNIMGTDRLLGKWWMVASLLKVLKEIHPGYKDLELPSDAEIREKVEHSIDQIIHRAVVVNDAEALAVEKQIGSDIAQVMHGEQEESIMGEEQGENTNPHMSYSCVKNVVDLDGNHDSAAVQRNALQAIAELVEVGKTESELLGKEETTRQFTVSANEEGKSNELLTSGVHEENFIFNVDEVLKLTIEKSAGKSRRAKDPIGDYTGDENTIGLAFPSVFLFGRVYGKPAINYKRRQLSHLLHHFTRVPAKNFALLAYLEDCITRNQNSVGVCAHVKSNPSSFRVISDLVNDQTKQDEIDEAVKKPKSKKAKELLRKYVPHLSFSSRNVNYSLLQCMKFRSDCLAASKRFGAPSEFLTLTFDTLNNPRSFRASFATVSNEDFPAVFAPNSWAGSSPDEFVEKLRDATVGRAHSEIPVDIGSTLNVDARERASVEDPVAHVEEVKKIISTVCEVLFGQPAEGFFNRHEGTSERSTKYYFVHKGVLGHTLGYLFVVEDHAKGTLHIHVVLYGGISPHVLQLACQIPELQKKIAEVLDSQHVQKLPTLVHVKELVKEYVRFKIPQKKTVPTILEKTDPVEVVKDWVAFNENKYVLN